MEIGWIEEELEGDGEYGREEKGELGKVGSGREVSSRTEGPGSVAGG